MEKKKIKFLPSVMSKRISYKGIKGFNVKRYNFIIIKTQEIILMLF